MYHKDSKNEVLGKLKKTILNSISDFKLNWDATYVPDELGPDFDKNLYEDNIENVIFKEIQKLSQKDKDTIICDYGMIKSIKLLHDFQKIGCGDSPEEICEYMENEILENIMCDDMVALIIKGDINFRNDWQEL
jgi:hypothetical protein